MQNQRIDLGQGAWLHFVETFITDHVELMRELLGDLPLRQQTIRIMGRDILMPRRTSWHGDRGMTYTYSGKTFEAEPWTPELTQVQLLLEQMLGHRFNSVLVNHYRDGSDSVGWHADDEPEIGPVIASVSLGARRRFVLKENATGEKREFNLGWGDLLVMGGTTQEHFQHCIPKTKKAVGPRLNLTFRKRR